MGYVPRLTLYLRPIGPSEPAPAQTKPGNHVLPFHTVHLKITKGIMLTVYRSYDQCTRSSSPGQWKQPSDLHQAKRLPCAKGAISRPADGGIVLLNILVHSSCLPAWWGRFPLGVPFARSKGTKTRLGRSPLRTPLGVLERTCVKAIVGPSPLLWRLGVPPHQAALGSWPYSWAVSTSGPSPAGAAFPPPGIFRTVPLRWGRGRGGEGPQVSTLNQNPCRKAAHHNFSFFIIHYSF